MSACLEFFLGIALRIFLNFCTKLVCLLTLVKEPNFLEKILFLPKIDPKLGFWSFNEKSRSGVFLIFAQSYRNIKSLKLTCKCAPNKFFFDEDRKPDIFVTCWTKLHQHKIVWNDYLHTNLFFFFFFFLRKILFWVFGWIQLSPECNLWF